MQTMLVNNIGKLRAKGENKALLISATGTGKTYASAFALRDINPPRALFLVHREQIARQAVMK
jgi:superfamily II DNA or RNA helicase